MPFSDLNAEELIEALPDAVIIIDHLGNILYANETFIHMLGIDRQTAVGENIIHFLRDDSTFDTCMGDIDKNGACADQETTFIHADGHSIPTIKSVRAIEHNGEPMVLALIRNLSILDSRNKALERARLAAHENARKLTSLIDKKDEELSSARTQLEEILNTIHEIIWYIDDSTMQVRYVSRAVESVFGVTRQAFLDQPDLWQQMVYAEDRQRVQRFFEEIQTGDAQHAIDFRIKRADGEIRWLNNRISHHPQLHFFIGITHDITDSKSSKDLVEFLAYHDPLTQLPNRIYLKEAIEKMIERSRTIDLHFALLFLDLDNFKYINDSMGHEVGDSILVQIAKRMQKAVSSKAEIIRFGGDEFIVLLNDVQDNADIELCGKTLLRSFKEPFLIHEEQFFLSASIGIALYPEHALSPSDLIKHSDTAMYAAKRSGKNQYRFYQPEMDHALQEFLQIEQRIREGIEYGYFRLKYQPFVDASTLSLKGFEALLRYEHPEGIVLTPAQFIPVAERTGDILKLSEFVFRESCAFSKKIMRVTGTWLPVSINLSARQFQDNQLLHTLKHCLRVQQIPAEALALEVTESVVMRDIDTVRVQLETLRHTGFRIALDDFGTGYSSLEYLAKLPIDILKIDKSFVDSLFESKQNQHLVQAITTMAEVMGMEVTAEGVENMEQVDFLLHHGVRTLQGFLFSEALSADEVEEKLTQKALYFAPHRQMAFTI